MTSSPHKTPEGSAARPLLDRRTALARLGLSAAVAYVAPTVLHLDRSANAVVVPSPCPKGKGNPPGAPWCRRRDRDHDDDDDRHRRRGRRSGSGDGEGGGRGSSGGEGGGRGSSGGGKD